VLDEQERREQIQQEASEMAAVAAIIGSEQE
jgi:DNA-directed RNA polymerase subunit omega